MRNEALFKDDNNITGYPVPYMVIYTILENPGVLSSYSFLPPRKIGTIELDNAAWLPRRH